MQKESLLVYNVTGNYLPLISFFFSISKRPTDPTKEVKWPVKRSINLKWPNYAVIAHCPPKYVEIKEMNRALTHPLCGKQHSLQ